VTKLVIVESPAKARTISAFLGPEFDVEASIGHIRDLPQPSELPEKLKKGPYGRFAVDTENDFDPYYVVDPGKKKKVAELKAALKEADELYLATDEDREGEAIAWHLLETLKPKVPVKRMVFNEITKEAINRALDNPRNIDLELVDAQESRRILDRLYGYEVSPLLWRKVAPRLSAGRVQSVATRLVVERERERRSFVAASYWSVEGPYRGGEETFTAKLSALDGRSVASGRDFADDGDLTAAASKKDVVVLTQESAEAIATALGDAVTGVSSVESKPQSRRPAPPFTTSTLQQEASRKLGLNGRQAMSTAQQLYENGFITYMRTDSTALSGEAIRAAREQVAERYGKDYVPEKPRVYAKKQKGAQEAHEAIRPAGDHFRTPEEVRGQLSGVQLRMYELIWKRTLASQMADAKVLTVSVRLVAPVGGAAGFSEATLSASGTVVTFPGYLAVYEEGRDKSRYEDSSSSERLPDLHEGDVVDPVDPGPEASGHSTTPPSRYTDATLVKKLEELGIGRPSTYAAMVDTITNRGYVDRRGQALVPTWVAFSVVRLLEDSLPEYIDYQFTADMENDLDQIAAGKEDRVHYLRSFYDGGDDHPGLRSKVANLGDIDARAINTIPLGEGVDLRVGKYGPYVEEAPAAGEETGRRASVPEDIAPDELTLEKARELLDAGADDGRSLGTDPDSGLEIIAKAGRYGPYVTQVLPEDAPKSAKPKTASLFKDMDLSTISLEQALQLLSLPRVIGTDEDGKEITAQNGRYGPYLKKGTDSRTIDSEDKLLTMTLDEAKAIYAQPKQRGGRTAAAPLKEFGDDPVSSKPVVLKDGRFGPYVTDGEHNASLRKGDSPENITPERAFELLELRREYVKNNPPKKRTTRKAPAKKTAAKSTATKKTTVKKPPSTTRNTVTRKRTTKKAGDE